MYQPLLLMRKRAQKEIFPTILNNLMKQVSVSNFPVSQTAILTVYLKFPVYIDQTSKELTALRILSECLAKGRMSLCYLYEECMVCILCYLHELIFDNGVCIFRNQRVLKVLV